MQSFKNYISGLVSRPEYGHGKWAISFRTKRESNYITMLCDSKSKAYAEYKRIIRLLFRHYSEEKAVKITPFVFSTLKTKVR